MNKVIYFFSCVAFQTLCVNANANESSALSSNNIFPIAWVFRLIERSILSLVVISLAIVVVVAFWKSVQKVDASSSTGGISFGFNMLIATPVFVLLILVGYAYVVMSFPLETDFSSEFDVKNGPSPNESRKLKIKYANQLANSEKIHEVGSAIASLDYLRSTNQLILPSQESRIEFDGALNILSNFRADLVIQIEGGDAMKFWKQNGSDYLLNPGKHGPEDKRRLDRLAPWFTRKEMN